MRAGLLSQPEVIQKLNDRFVTTTITYTDLKELAKKRDELAVTTNEHFLGPVELIFLNSEGQFMSKVTVVNDFTDIHPDTDIRPGQKYDPSPAKNVEVFLRHVHEVEQKLGFQK